MKLISLKIQWFKNLDVEIDFMQSEWISVFVWNNGSGKSNILEAISAIFYGLYDETGRNRADFSYEIKYMLWKDLVEIKQRYWIWGWSMWLTWSAEMHSMWPETEWRMYSFIVNGESVRGSKQQYLPSNVIALYSGEESRLYENYYSEIFQEYIGYTRRDLTRNLSQPMLFPQMIFIDKDYWNIAILTMFLSMTSLDESDVIYSWIKKILWDWILPQLIQFTIDEKNLDKFKQTEITNFVQLLKDREDITFSELREFNESTWLLWRWEELFKNLSIASNRKDNSSSLLLKIDIELSNWINVMQLSEWQKKQILIYFVTQILAKRDTIVLLDEPDSYIHVGNKERIKTFITDFLDITGEWEFILSTHSPTLMHKLDKKHIFYLESGKIKWKEKREILNEITAGQMTMTEMEILLSSHKKYLLVTEWITDKKHLEIAMEKLWIENQYDIYSADSCEKLTNFLITLPENIFSDKTIIWIYDADQPWLKALRHLWDEIEFNKRYKVSGKNNRIWISLPFQDTNFNEHQVFTIEFMYSKDLLKAHNLIVYRTVDDINKCIREQERKLNFSEIQNQDCLFFYKVSESENSKNSFTESAREFKASEFEWFRILFQLIDNL